MPRYYILQVYSSHHLTLDWTLELIATLLTHFIQILQWNCQILEIPLHPLLGRFRWGRSRSAGQVQYHRRWFNGVACHWRGEGRPVGGQRGRHIVSHILIRHTELRESASLPAIAGATGRPNRQRHCVDQTEVPGPIDVVFGAARCGSQRWHHVETIEPCDFAENTQRSIG